VQDKTDKSKPILIVEDSMPDYLTVVRVFRKLGYENAIFHCESGQEALDYLHHKGEYENEAEAPRPVVILLDLNMPGTDGREVLKHIKTDENLKAIPVVIFTTSDSERDIEDCYRNGANSYITKPVDLEKLLNVMDVFKNYWFKTSALPAPA
jgi:CheY-like chemotaxis protein